MTRAAAPVFLTAGEVMVELAGSQPLAAAQTLRRSYSGDVLNVAVGIRRLGLPSTILTKVGDDPFGDYLLDEWRALGVDLRHVTRGDGPTGLYIVEQGIAGDYDVWYYRRGSAASTIGPAEIDGLELSGIQMVHVSGIAQAISATSRAATLRLAERARERDIMVSFDVNYRHRIWSPSEAAEAAWELLPLTDLVFCGAPDEARVVTGCADAPAAAEYFLDRGIRIAALSKGADGAYVAWQGGAIELPHVARRVTVAQGGGDAFAGGFAAGHLLGLPPAACARLATVTAGLKVERRGPLLGLPLRADMVARAQELGWDDVAAPLAALANAGGAAVEHV